MNWLINKINEYFEITNIMLISYSKSYEGIYKWHHGLTRLVSTKITHQGI